MVRRSKKQTQQLDLRCQITDPLYGTLDMSSSPELKETFEQVYWPLARTFEMTRGHWLYQAGSLFYLFPGATHTRTAHAAGCWSVGCYALQDVKVVAEEYSRSGKLRNRTHMSLGDWLKGTPPDSPDLRKEFLASLLLHDVGHCPLSHAIEYTVGLDVPFRHEEITVGLIGGDDAPVGQEWYPRLLWWLTAEAWATFGREDPGLWHGLEEAMNRATVAATVGRLNDKGILSRHVLCKMLHRPGSEQPGDVEPRIHAVRVLVDGTIDIDRLDHVLRDSYYSGLKIASYDVRMLLQNLSIVSTSEARMLHGEIARDLGHSEPPDVYLCVEKEGIPYMNSLLSARELSYQCALWLPENLFHIAALGHAIRIANLIAPDLIQVALPFHVDRTVLELFKHPRFAGIARTLDQYASILRGATDPREYRWKLYRYAYGQTISTREDLQLLANLLAIVEELNQTSGQDKPLVLLFTNARIKKEEAPWFTELVYAEPVQGGFRRIGEIAETAEFVDWIDSNRKLRQNNVYIWYRKDAKAEEELRARLAEEGKPLSDYGLTEASELRYLR